MQRDTISIEDAAKAVPCDEQTLHRWLQQGHIHGHDNFGRRDRQITPQSAGIMIDVASLMRHCASIGVIPGLDHQ